VRIVAGEWKGRPLVAPKGRDTRPTSDRVREALFSAITARVGPDLARGAVLDLFAGTGALALEALSRGASRAVLVENDRAALAAIGENVATLDAGDRVTVIAANVLGAGVMKVKRGGPFALLFCDPPYRIEQARVAATLKRLAEAGAVEFGAALVWEHAATAKMPEPDGFARESNYRYGDTAVTLFRYYGDGRTSSK
jgi:16S rRNA (guanine966-N2)-methyltransferase